MPDKPRVFSVGQLSQSIRRNLLANNEKIADAWIEGELSDNRLYPSGHRYFILKDRFAQIDCTLFAFNLGACDAAFRQTLAGGEACVNGLKVQVQGELDVNMSRGRYSFKVRALRLAGAGDKMAAFHALKAKLEAEGLNKLDHPALRRSLPFLPHRIGIVTSEAGAVIHDMCTVITRRFPNVEIRLFPAKVQGDGAVESLVKGVRFFNGALVAQDTTWRADVIIIGRGGGSAEDLWVFNEEPVVRAVAGSAIPIVSAVGHESDVTLCDYVADLRAGTPSIAGERVVPVKAELTLRVRELAARLQRAPQMRLETLAQQLDYLTRRLGEAPEKAYGRVERRLAEIAARLAPALREAAGRFETRLARVSARLEPCVRAAVQRAEANLREQARALAAINPLAVLERGYSVTTDGAGHVVRRAADVTPGTVLKTRLAAGTLESTVTAVVENPVC